MTQIPSVDANVKTATYNAVKIQINDPKTNIGEDFKSNPDNNGTYNAVNVEVNRPTIESNNKPQHRIYDYPEATNPITYDMVPVHQINVPTVLPYAYTNNFVNNRTLINAELEFEQEFQEPEMAEETPLVENEQETTVNKDITVPEPQITTTEEQKADTSEVAFNGINFKADESKQTLDIVPPIDIKPDVDIPAVLDNLANPDFDIQAKQMEEIAKVSMESPQKAIPYIVTEVFSELVNIVKKDTSDLTPPSEKQIETRKQIIINELVKEQAKIENKDESEIELPYKLDESEIKEATDLSSLEQAERNKEYALYTMSILAKVYTDEIEKQTGNVVPLTDLPGVSAVVDTLRYNSNSSVKIAAIDALRYISRPEYKDELNSVLTLAANDTNPYVARSAATTIESLN